MKPVYGMGKARLSSLVIGFGLIAGCSGDPQAFVADGAGSESLESEATQSSNGLLEASQESSEGGIQKPGHYRPEQETLRQATDPAAIVDAFDPVAASVDTRITILGRNFQVGDLVFFGGERAGNVDYGGVPARISAVVPPKAKSGRIGVNASQSGSSFRVTPTLSDFSPDRGTPSNTTVVISGTGYNDKPITVQFRASNGTINGQVTGGDERSIGVTVPPGATTGRLTVITTGGSMRSARDFEVLPQLPAIKNNQGFTPKIGPVGTQVRIFAKVGTKFEQISDVTFKGPGIPKRVAAQFSVLNAGTEIFTLVPAGAVTGPIRVQNLTGADATSEDFQVTAN